MLLQRLPVQPHAVETSRPLRGQCPARTTDKRLRRCVGRRNAALVIEQKHCFGERIEEIKAGADGIRQAFLLSQLQKLLSKQAGGALKLISSYL